MKKTILSVVLIIAFLLTSCTAANVTAATNAAASTSSTESANASAVLDTSYTDAVSVELQLLYGILNLEGSDQAITTDQAAILLPLWQSLQTEPGSMGGGPGGGMQPPSGDANATPQAPAGNDASGNQQMPTITALSQDEIDAVLVKIQAALAGDQISAIANMKITQTMIESYISENNLGMGNGQAPQGNDGMQPPTRDTNSTPQAPSGNGNGQPPEGAPSGNSQQGGPSDNDQSGTPDPSQQPDMTTNVLINAVINLLQQKTGTAQTNNNSAGGQGQQGGSPENNNSAAANILAAYTVDGQSLTEDGKTYTASEADQSAILVANGGALILTNATVTTSGDSSSTDNSSFYGQNAAVLVQANSSLTMSNSTINTSGIGANGAFAAGENALLTLTDVTIVATGNGGHAVMATLGGKVVLVNLDMTTSGDSSSAVATDRGSGTIDVTGCKIKVSGNNSAGLYSTGIITVADTTITSTGAEAAVIEGANSIILTGSSLTSSYDNKWGVMIYQSMSGDAEGSEGTYTMTGGSLSYTGANGPLFYVTNTTANINLSGVALSEASGILLRAEAGNWGNSGSNGGTVILSADEQTLTGDILADAISAVTLTLKNGSALTGAVDNANTAKSIVVTLDGTSTWTLTGNSYVTTISGAVISGSSVTNITGNGFNVYYESSANPELNGQTYSLIGGGSLMPA